MKIRLIQVTKYEDNQKIYLSVRKIESLEEIYNGDDFLYSVITMESGRLINVTETVRTVYRAMKESNYPIMKKKDKELFRCGSFKTRPSKELAQ